MQRIPASHPAIDSGIEICRGLGDVHLCLFGNGACSIGGGPNAAIVTILEDGDIMPMWLFGWRWCQKAGGNVLAWRQWSELGPRGHYATE